MKTVNRPYLYPRVFFSTYKCLSDLGIKLESINRLPLRVEHGFIKFLNDPGRSFIQFFVVCLLYLVDRREEDGLSYEKRPIEYRAVYKRRKYVNVKILGDEINDERFVSCFRKQIQNVYRHFVGGQWKGFGVYRRQRQGRSHNDDVCGNIIEYSLVLKRIRVSIVVRLLIFRYNIMTWNSVNIIDAV